MPSFN